MSNLFKPEQDLMKQLFKLTKDNASQWYKEYLAFHKGKDQGIYYLIGYFSDKKRLMLKKQFGL